MKTAFKLSLLWSVVSLLFGYGYFKHKGVDNPFEMIKEVRAMAVEMGQVDKKMSQGLETANTLNNALESRRQNVKNQVKELEARLKNLNSELKEECYVFIRNQYIKCRDDNTYTVDGETIYHVKDDRIPASELSELNPNVKKLHQQMGVEAGEAKGIMAKLKQAKQNMKVRNDMLDKVTSDSGFRKKQ